MIAPNYPPEKQKSAMPKRPNVIWVLADQLRAQALSCDGETNICTPSIDLATVKSTSVLTSALFAITYNALNGDVQTACRGTDGKPLYFEFANMSVTSAEQLAQMNGWDDASTGNWCATTDVVDGMLTIVNPDLTAEEINTYLGTLDFETLKSMMD